MPAHFDQLWEIHKSTSPETNLARIAKATTGIIPRGTPFAPDESQRLAILDAPERAARILNMPQVRQKEEELTRIVKQFEAEILEAAKLNNVNLRGNKIEQIITLR